MREFVPVPATPKWMVIVGWVLTILPATMFVAGGAYAAVKPEMMNDGSKQIGFPTEYGHYLVGLEIVCGLLYLIPQTAVLGAILLTGYLGGAAACHLRVHETGKMFVPVVFGIVLWLGLFFRDARVRSLLPIRFTR